MKIDEIEIYTATEKTPRPLRLSYGEIDRRTYLFVRIVSGRYEGWGEIFSLFPRWGVIETTAAIEELSKLLVGREWSGVDEILDHLYRATQPLRMVWGKGAISRVLSGIDMALHDLLGRMENKPVYQLLGGMRNREARVYVTGLGPGDVEKIKTWMDRGVEDFKLRVGFDLERDIETVRQFIEATGLEKVMVDANMGYTMEEALSLLREVGDHIKWFEEPVYMDDIGALDMVKRIAIMNFDELWIAGGENIYDRHDLLRLFEKYRLIDVYMPDVSKTGGYRIAKELIGIVRKNKVLYSPHYYASLYGFYATLHLAAAEEDLAYIQIDGLEADLRDRLVRRDRPEVREGAIDLEEALDDRPGIGVEIETKLLRG